MTSIERMSDELISVSEAAKEIGISRQAVLQAIDAKKIEAFKVGRNYNVVKASAIAYKESRKK